VVVPWIPVAAAEVEQFEGALGACAGRYVTGGVSVLSCVRVSREGSLHVRQVTGDDESVVAYERFTGCAHALLPVLCERDV